MFPRGLGTTDSGVLLAICFPSGLLAPSVRQLFQHGYGRAQLHDSDTTDVIGLCAIHLDESAE